MIKEKKRIEMTRSILRACVLSVFGMTFLMGCGQKSASTASAAATGQAAGAAEEVGKNDNTSANTPGADDDIYMKAPHIETDGEGLIVLEQCPTKDAHLTVKLSEDNTKAEIFYDGSLIQTIGGGDDALVAAGGDIPVYFMDANFDGLTDIFIGPGASRTYSTLLVWNPAKEEFVRVGSLGEPSLQGFTLEPATESAFEGGSGSYCMFVATRSKWDSGQLKPVESMTIITDPTQYEANQVSNKYTIRDDQDNVKQSTDISSELPKSWQNVVKIYDVE